VKCAISWGRCSLIGLLVVMSVVVVLVPLLFSFPVDGVCVWGGGGPVPFVFFGLFCFFFFGRVGLVFFFKF